MLNLQNWRIKYNSEYIIDYFTIIYHEIHKGRMDSEGRIKETRDITTAMKRTSVYKTRGNLIS